MTSRGPQSALSSRDVSPEPRPDAYDPLRSDDDHIELTHIQRPRLDAGDSYGSRSRSPLRSPLPSPEDHLPEGPRGRLRPDSYFGASLGSAQYSPVAGRESSPRPSMRSGRESTYTLNSLYHSKATDAVTQALVDRRAGEIAHWHIYWTTPALIVFLFLAGVAAAAGHHFFYASLNGQPAVEQLKMVRYGTALAFFVKSTLVGCVIMCNRQRIWYTFRQKAMTISGIDGLFSACEDPTQFFLNWEMIKMGKVATFMAACSWLIPLASVMSPASLTSEARVFTNSTMCSAVATVNFTREAIFNFRNENEVDGRGTSVNYYNTTDRDGTKEGYFDYYDQPSKQARRLAYSAAYLRRPQPRERAAISFCGEGWNCTYPITFLGPGYKCDDISDDTTGAPFELSQIAPLGNYTYLAEVDQNNYLRPQIETKDGIPIQQPPYPDSLGDIQSEPILWIGYSNKTDQLYDPASPNAAKWKYVHEPKMFKCAMYQTNYTFEMRYRPSQTAVLKQRDFIQPLIDTTLVRPADNSSAWVATPTKNHISPKSDPETYKMTAAYHSMGTLLRTFLRGNIEKTSDVFIVTRSDISETRLINSRTSYPQPDLMVQIQALFEDMLITLMSEPTLVLAEPQDVQCDKTRVVVVYVYYRRGLWIGYAVVILITFAFILVGAWSLYKNGVASDVLFSRIMVTTRNPTLDHLSVGACLGGDPFPRELTKTKLRFGVLLEDDPREGPFGKVEHCTFGTVGETKEIVKGGTYAGLRKWRKTDGGQKYVDEKSSLLGLNGA
ncbi:hypothetical protein ACN47E_009147 [Coniothyrium glycines]